MTIRFPKELYHYLQERAEAEHRSLNDEVLYLLELGIGEAEKVDETVKEIRQRSTEELRRSVEEREYRRRQKGGE